MNEETAIILFCLIDDFLKTYRQKRLRDPKQQIMTDSEVVFAGILSAYWHGGNFRRGLVYSMEKKYCLKVLSESQFLRRIKSIPQEVWKRILILLAQKAKAYNCSEFVVDSFPYAVCHNMRILQSRIVQGSEYRGYTASKREYFYGLKIHAIIGTCGVPVSLECFPGSINDLTAFKNMNMDALDGGILYADAAYNDYNLEEQLAKYGLVLIAARQSNSTRPWPEKIGRLLAKRRKIIETFFSTIMRLFPRRIHAVRLSGLILKMTLFFVAFSGMRVCQI
jgi:hypothetical protein